jgi:hypothetical protein
MMSKGFLLMFFLVCSGVSSGISEVRWQAIPKAGVAVRSRFQFAEPFVRMLERAGIAVESVEQSTSEALFTRGTNAAFLYKRSIPSLRFRLSAFPARRTGLPVELKCDRVGHG